MITIGMPSCASPTSSRTRATVIPCASAAWVERWMVGPSASGSLKGTPTSTKSAPAASARRRAAMQVAGVGYPAVRYGINAARRRSLPPPSARIARHRRAIGCSDKVVADLEAVFLRVGDFDDGPREVATRITLRKVDDGARVEESAVRGRHDPHDGAVHVADVRVGGMHERHLVGVENDARAHRGDADEIDERLHNHRIVAAPGVLPQLL